MVKQYSMQYRDYLSHARFKAHTVMSRGLNNNTHFASDGHYELVHATTLEFTVKMEPRNVRQFGTWPYVQECTQRTYYVQWGRDVYNTHTHNQPNYTKIIQSSQPNYTKIRKSTINEVIQKHVLSTITKLYQNKYNPQSTKLYQKKYYPQPTKLYKNTYIHNQPNYTKTHTIHNQPN